MWKIIFFIMLKIDGILMLWDKENICPLVCICQLQHISETAIYRFTQQDENEEHHSEAHNHENNEVLYDDDFDTPFDEQNSMLRSATCILQTETDVEKLLVQLPKDIDSLVLIQGSDSGNKTMKFSYLLEFPDLTILELQGVQMKALVNTSELICEIDATLPLLEYLNLERVLLLNSEKRFTIIENEINDEMVTFEYLQKVNSNSRPLSFVAKPSNTEILPYYKYIQQVKNNVPLFKGFNALILLRAMNCDLNTVYWEMFDGLHNLKYLLLEKNNLRFIPDFAFYGTPNLKTLSLAYNNLLNIQVTNLAGLLELAYLDLSNNNFSQLSELSLPPFPKLKLANFGNNPITVVFPNTFEVMNTTDSLILGGDDTELSLITNSFLGLKLLKKLTLRNLNVPLLKRDILIGMPSLSELILTGNIPNIEFDAFTEAFNLEKLYISRCNISKVSVDSFMGLNKLKLLDLSQNNLDFLPLGIFNELPNLREVYLNNNKFQGLAKQIFSNPHLRIIRLNDNPWHCSCDMSDWKPMLINRIKQKTVKSCRQKHDKGVECGKDNHFTYKYIYENRVAPKCTTPKTYENWNVFHVMRKQLSCTGFKPKIKKLIVIPKFTYSDRNINKISQINETKTFSNYASLETTTEIGTVEATSTEAHSRIESYNYNTENEFANAKALKKQKLLTKFNEKLIKYLYRNDTNVLELAPQNTIFKLDNNNENIDENNVINNNIQIVDTRQYKLKPKKPLKRKIRKRVFKPKAQNLKTISQ